MISFEEQLSLFKIIGKELKRKVECIAIGGNAMMFYGFKGATKDVDLVFLNKKDLNEVKQALFNSGFKEKNNIKIFKNYEIIDTKPIMMEGAETRFDLFCNEIICFRMSESIINRIKEIHEFSNLVIKIVSPEDIILLKCATEREKDRVDAVEIIKKYNINWKVIMEESLHQTELNKPLFVVFLYEFLLELKEGFNMEIPKEVLETLLKKSEEEMIKRLKTKKVSIHKI